MTTLSLRAELIQRARITGRRAAIAWEADLKRTSPVDTGTMRNETTVRDRPSGRNVIIEAKVNTEYAEYVRSGTAPHPIVPVNAQALRFNWRGETVFFGRVNHPGTAANPWFDEATRRADARMSALWAATA